MKKQLIYEQLAALKSLILCGNRLHRTVGTLTPYFVRSFFTVRNLAVERWGRNYICSKICTFYAL